MGALKSGQYVGFHLIVESRRAPWHHHPEPALAGEWLCLTRLQWPFRWLSSENGSVRSGRVWSGLSTDPRIHNRQAALLLLQQRVLTLQWGNISQAFENFVAAWVGLDPPSCPGKGEIKLRNIWIRTVV